MNTPAIQKVMQHAGALYGRGDLSAAEAIYRQILVAAPDHLQAINNLGITLRAAGRRDEAIEQFRLALKLQPASVEAHNNLGNALQDIGRIDQSIASFSRALALCPTDSRIHVNLGNALFMQGQIDRAIESYDRALALSDDPAIASRRLIALQFHPRFDPPMLLAECMRWDERYAAKLRPFIETHGNDRDPDRRLKIGYVSADFRDHVAGWYMAPLLANHDHDKFEIFCYQANSRADAMTRRLASFADQWREIHDIGDESAAQMIRSDAIDILVDLSMHTEHNRLLVFARKPAPVQVCWLASLGSTGLSTMDYRLTDPYFDPPGEHDDHYSEKNARLPDSFSCYDPAATGGGAPLDLAAGSLPALANGYVTFGCLNKYSRINRRVWALWSGILRALPNSRLILSVPPGARSVVNTALRQQAIAQDRVECLDHAPWKEYLLNYRRIDIVLDTLPYNGNTTSMDALWMGVPLVTRVGQCVQGRAGWSLLSNLKLTELAAWTDEDFVRIATDLANDLPRLSQLRRTLRQRMARSPLTNSPDFAGNVEAAYRRMWRTWSQTK